MKITFFALYCGHFGKGKEFDVQMPADLDQLGRDNSHGAVIGRECLVQLGHCPANGRRLFYQMDEKA